MMVTIFWNVFDILFLAYVFYRILLLFQGTHATQVLLGLGVLFLTTLAARDILQLRATGWMFDQFWSVAIVMLAVVFQPELRSALSHLGRHPMGGVLIAREMHFVDEILEAVDEASRRQIGVLLVLEQETGLRTFIETGTMVNGDVSKELLMSIFHYRSPLHDGAAVVQNGKLTAAGCLLPLSNEPNLAKVLGTRHRAAVGLSEISDALVVVVSEETGTISLAKGGQLIRDLDLDGLREQITSAYREQARKTVRLFRPLKGDHA